MEHFFPEFRQRPKNKRSSPESIEMEHFFSPNSSRDLRSDAHQSQIIGGDASEDHTQIVGEDTVELLEGIYPPHPPRVSAPLHLNSEYNCGCARLAGVLSYFFMPRLTLFLICS